MQCRACAALAVSTQVTQVATSCRSCVVAGAVAERRWHFEFLLPMHAVRVPRLRRAVFQQSGLRCRWALSCWCTLAGQLCAAFGMASLATARGWRSSLPRRYAVRHVLACSQGSHASTHMAGCTRPYTLISIVCTVCATRHRIYLGSVDNREHCKVLTTLLYKYSSKKPLAGPHGWNPHPTSNALRKSVHTLFIECVRIQSVRNGHKSDIRSRAAICPRRRLRRCSAE